MPSLRQLLAAHAPLLLIDASSARVQVGLWTGATAEPRWQAQDAEAGMGVFAGVETLLTGAGLRIADLKAYVFCEGPGSVLGIRTSAVALRVWRVLNPAPAFSFQSLGLVAAALGDQAARVIADARRDSWHVAQLGAPLRRVPTAELAGDLVMPEHFRSWTPLPANLHRTPYDLAALLPAVADVDLFQPTDAPDAFLHEEPAYATWTPQVHQMIEARGQRPGARGQKSEVRGQKAEAGGRRPEAKGQRASASEDPAGAGAIHGRGENGPRQDPSP